MPTKQSAVPDHLMIWRDIFADNFGINNLFNEQLFFLLSFHIFINMIYFKSKQNGKQ